MKVGVLATPGVHGPRRVPVPHPRKVARMLNISTAVQPLRRSFRNALPRHTRSSLAGAGLGLLAFLFFGLLPSLLTGGAIGAQLARWAFGEAPSGLGVDAIVVLGVSLAATLGATVFALLGATTCAAISVLAGTPVAYKVAP
jgi:hypothetical protein